MDNGTLMLAPAPNATATWRDPWRYLWLFGLLVPLLMFSGGALALATGATVFWWLTPIVLYVIVPVIDWRFGANPVSPPETAVATLQQDPYYRWCTYLFIPLQYAALLSATWMLVHGGLGVMAALGLLWSAGIVSVIAVSAGHELGHKREQLERWLARIALAPSAYGHFLVEHNRGHHVRVATPEDPASARLGESLWAFLPRTVIGSLRSAWELEGRRLSRDGMGVWHWRNENLQAWSLTVALFSLITAWLGWGALPILCAQALVGFTMLEVVNYLEHYGLLRQRDEHGRYERCRAEHSWNSNHLVTNVLLYNLQRHSDHHAHPTRRYQALRACPQAPQLPCGYASMIPLTFVPLLWRAVMDPRVITHYGGDVTRANIHPPERARILARYGRRQPAR